MEATSDSSTDSSDTESELNTIDHMERALGQHSTDGSSGEEHHGCDAEADDDKLAAEMSMMSVQENDEELNPGLNFGDGAGLEEYLNAAWVNRRYVDEESDEEEGEFEFDKDDDEDDYSAMEAFEEHFAAVSRDEIEDEWDLQGDGLPDWDSIGEDFDREAAEIGEYHIIPHNQISSHIIWYTEDKLDDDDMSLLRAFALKVGSHMSDKTFAKLPYAFPHDNVPTIDVTRSRAQFLSGFKPEKYHCCVNSCCCFVGPHEDLDECPYCDETRYHPKTKRPRKVFTYLPLIPRLTALYANAERSKEMRYRAEGHEHLPGRYTDIFDSDIYRRLLGRPVIIDEKEAQHTYFNDPHDLALGLATDGFGPFKHRKSTAWPLVLFNYNLPPDTRVHIDHSIPLGVIPGPKKPHDYDSFQWPAVMELLKLQLGVRAWDGYTQASFMLRAYLILVFGDIPAISMVMRMTGHNGFSPCRMCKILGVRVPNSRGTTNYVPLDRSNHPTVLASRTEIRKYDPANLPLRSEDEMLSQGREVQSANTAAEEKRLARKYGIKGVPILSYLKSLSFPLSFPYDFMHLIWENLIPNLLLLWTGSFKGLDDGVEEYTIGKNVWDAIGVATTATGSTIPSAFGARQPNFRIHKSACSAETWSFWTLYIGPVLLRREFSHARYYNHFIRLVELLNICLQFEISDAEVQTLREGFNNWVEEYEK